MTHPLPKQRLDKWLFHARFFKTRTLAAKMANAGHVRVNSAKVSKASHGIALGDVLTFAQGRDIRVVRVEAFADRRGPASAAQALYADLAPAPDKDTVPSAARTAGNGRPDKRDRRKLDFKRRQELE